MTNEQEQQLTKELKSDIAKIVLKYAELKLDADLISAHMVVAAMKVTNASCSAMIKERGLN